MEYIEIANSEYGVSDVLRHLASSNEGKYKIKLSLCLIHKASHHEDVLGLEV
jgi:hypothetical protein